jgi:hypothetical protein
MIGRCHPVMDHVKQQAARRLNGRRIGGCWGLNLRCQKNRPFLALLQRVKVGSN